MVSCCLGAATVAGIEERGKARTYAIEIRVRPAHGMRADACADFGAGDLAVRLRGERVDPDRVAIDRRPRRRVHALLLDTSASMNKKLDDVRAAAAGYVRRLDPELERAFVMTFDDSPAMVAALTANRERLLAAVEEIRPGGFTALNDGLLTAIDELSLSLDRPALVLITDGFDTTSSAFRDDVRIALAQRPDLAVFPIGYALPSQFRAGGHDSTQLFLQALADTSNGRFFESNPLEDLPAVYAEIRALLDSEATVLVADPEPERDAGVVRVGSTRRDCGVEMLSGLNAASPAKTPERSYVGALRMAPFHDVDAGCEKAGYGRAKADLLEAAGNALRGCLLDVVSESGILHDRYGTGSGAGRWRRNPYNETRMRRVAFPIPPLETLPSDPAEALDRWAAELARRSPAGRAEPRKIAERDGEVAIPVTASPVLVQGATLLRIRPDWAAALATDPEYAAHAHAGLQAEAALELADLREHYRLSAPGTSEAALDAAVRDSAAGRRIRERVERPGPRDLTRRLAGWFGDVAAAELFRRLEGRWLQQLLDGQDDPLAAIPDYLQRWETLLPWFRRADHVRVAGVMLPVRDPDDGRVGLYRVLLPRPAWVLARVQGRSGERGWVDVPFDEIPERPVALEEWAKLLAEWPELAAALRAGGYHLAELRYEPRGKPRHRDPGRVFRSFTTRASFHAAAGAGALAVSWVIDRDKHARRMTLTRSIEADGDPALLASAPGLGVNEGLDDTPDGAGVDAGEQR